MASHEREPRVLALRDGQLVTLRARSGADDAEVAGLLAIVGDPRIEFFTGAAAPPPKDFVHAALVARSASGELAGCATWVSEGGAGGEFAGAVDPRFGELGLGTLLLRCCAREALEAGLQSLRVELHPGSAATAEMLRDCGLRTHWDLAYPVVHVDLLLGPARPGWATPSGAAHPSALPRTAKH